MINGHIFNDVWSAPRSIALWFISLANDRHAGHFIPSASFTTLPPIPAVELGMNLRPYGGDIIAVRRRGRLQYDHGQWEQVWYAPNQHTQLLPIDSPLRGHRVAEPLALTKLPPLPHGDEMRWDLVPHRARISPPSQPIGATTRTIRLCGTSL